MTVIPPISTNDGIPVELPSGATFLVLTDEEREYVAERVLRYETQLALENVSDQAQLDLMVQQELLTYRIGLWLALTKDYEGDDIDEVALRRSLAELSREIRAIKKALGVDKVSRDKAKGTDNVADYLENLRTRAMAFGVMRNAQLAKGIELSQELIALTTLYTNCSVEERVEMHVTEKDIISWIRTVFVPEFQAVDEGFRTQQQMWIREM